MEGNSIEAKIRAGNGREEERIEGKSSVWKVRAAERR
jgi:hypothetical protein